MSDPLTEFLNAEINSWQGLQPDLMGSVLAQLGGIEPVLLPGRIGNPPAQCVRLSLPSKIFGGGLFAWQQEGQVITLEGCLPGADGERLLAPALPDPAAAYPFPLGNILLDDAERVYPDRGLAVRVNPGNGLLLGLVGFKPTTAADYERRLRPVHGPVRRLAAANQGVR